MNKTQYFAFNIWDIDSIRSVMDAAADSRHDVIIQTSSRIFEGMDHEVVRKFVSNYEEKIGIRAYLHLDHCRKPDVIKMAVDAGWDIVMLDASYLPLRENIQLTNEVCTYAQKRGVLVEAEVGQIPGVEDGITAGDGTANLEDIRQFLAQTDVNLFAAAIGTCHGWYRKQPWIRYDLIEGIRQITDKPFVVHGGSGLSDDDFRKLLSCKNVKKINISTELKQAYRKGILKAYDNGKLECNGFEVANVKQEVYESIKQAALKRLCLLKGEEGHE